MLGQPCKATVTCSPVLCNTVCITAASVPTEHTGMLRCAHTSVGTRLYPTTTCFVHSYYFVHYSMLTQCIPLLFVCFELPLELVIVFFYYYKFTMQYAKCGDVSEADLVHIPPPLSHCSSISELTVVLVIPVPTRWGLGACLRFAL